MKKNKFLLASVMATGLLSSMSAMAGPILTGAQIQTFSFNTLSSSTSLNFNGFNSNLGTLNSVHLTWVLNETIGATIVNLESTPQTIALNATTTTTVTGTGISALLTSNHSINTSLFNGTIVGGTVYTIPDVGNVTVSSKTPVSVNASHSGAVCLSNDGSCGSGSTNLNGFIGGANLFSVAVANSIGLSSLSYPLALTNNTVAANGNVSLIYDYTLPVVPVPEPVSFSLMGLGLIYLSAFRKKTEPTLWA